MDIINSFFEWVKSGIVSALNLLPDSPFHIEVPDFMHTIIGYVNFFIPIGWMVEVLAAWLACVAAWYVIMLVLRWIKAIE